MKIKSFLLPFILLTIYSSNVSSATVTVYDNVSDYNAATASQLFLIDFNSSPGSVVDGSTVSPFAVFGSPDASDPTQVLWNSDALTDAGSTISNNNVGPMSVDFVDPAIVAFSLDFLSSGEQETIELYDSNNDMFASVLSPNASGFFGLVSDTEIDSIIIRNGLFNNGTPDRFFIDNLSANAIPVPAALWLFLSGIAGLLMIKKSKH